MALSLGAQARNLESMRAQRMEGSQLTRRDELAQLRESLRRVEQERDELRRSEARLGGLVERLRSITDALPVLVSYVDLEQRYQFVSAAYERWFGRPRAEIVGKTVAEVLGATAYETVGPQLDRALSGQLARYQAPMSYRDGPERFVEATCIPQFGADGRVSGCVALVVDLTEQKELERFTHAVVCAERVEEVFEAALDAIQVSLAAQHAAILLHDQHGVMRFRAARQLSHEYQRAVEGHSPWPSDSLAPQPVLVPDVERAAELSALLPLLRREGIRSLAFIPLVTRGQLIGKFKLYYDQPHSYSPAELEISNAIASHLASVAARFAAIAKLEETVRYNELFAGVLAHDLRNPLGAMMMAAQVLLMRQESQGDRSAKPLSRILSSGQRMTRMIDQLLDFTQARVGGGIQVQPREANLAELCNQAIAELELANPDWKVESEVLGSPDGSWDPDRLLQIVSNLVGNAGRHGELERPIRVTLDGRQPECVSLAVHNSGLIPAALLPGLFDPFRGTRHRRDQSQGLGLGLFIVDALVRAHGGKVEVRSAEGSGTTFTVTLPRRPSRSEPVAHVEARGA
jgi:PAS domain S-box-containing protein